MIVKGDRAGYELDYPSFKNFESLLINKIFMKTKKELKQDYKQHQPKMGVFQIKNTVNNKVLIEGSTNISSKWNRHQTELKFGSHRNKELQKDWNEMNATSFSFEVLSELAYKEDEAVNYAEEIKVLRAMVLEELNLPKIQLY